MSLLDDVSIVVTPNGYKAGELYAVIPVPTEGAELVDCGNFECAVPLDDWTVQDGWTISGNKANYAPNTGRTIYQTITTEIGKVYKISYEVSNWVANAVGTYVIESSDAATALYEGNEDGNFSRTFTATGVTAIIRFRTSSTSANLSIDNASVKEVITASADMDVTRATAATRVDENGLVNYAEIIGGEEVTNGDFATDSDWTKGSAWSISGNNANFDDSTNSGISQSMVFTASKTYKVDFEITSGSGSIAFLSSNGATTYVSYATYGVGTYSVEFNYTTGSGFGIFGSSFLGGAFSITNISVKEVTRDNVPRIDYTGGGCPHILAEPQRTNLIPYSEDYTSGWIPYQASVTPSQFNALTNTNNATLLYPTISSSYASLFDTDNLTLGVYTFSVFAKESGKDFLCIDDTYGGKNWFNLSNGTLGTINSGYTAKIENHGNGWYKCSVTNNSNIAFDYKVIYIVTDADNSLTITKNGTDGILLFGSQTELGSYGTSYIPNFGTALGVTRNQDIFTRDGIGSLINSTEGVLFVEMARQEGDASAGVITLNNGTASQAVALYYFSTGTIYFDIISSSPTVSGGVGGFNTYNFNKIALKYKSGDIALWVNGEEVAASANAISLTGLNKISFDYGSGALPFFGKVKQLQVYNTALTDEQLLQLTGESGTDFYESYAEMASALTYTIQ